MDDNYDVGRIVIGADDPGVGELPAGVGVAGTAVEFTAMPDNDAGGVEFGPAGFDAGDGYPLFPGASKSIDYLNANEFTFRGTDGDEIAYLIVRS